MMAEAVERVDPHSLLTTTRIIFIESAYRDLDGREWTAEERAVDDAAERLFDALNVIRKWQKQIRSRMAA